MHRNDYRLFRSEPPVAYDQRPKSLLFIIEVDPSLYEDIDCLARCLKHLTTTGGHVSIIDIHNSLNIHFTGIHAVGNLFSVKLYKTRDQNEICRTISENVCFNGVLVYVCIIEGLYQCRRLLNDDR